MLEKTVETYLVDRVRAAGGDAYKFSSPARVSVPDRIVVFPPARIYFVEVKAPGGRVTKGQLREHERLRALGCDVRVINSREAVDAFVREASAAPAPYLHVYEYPSPFGGTHREFAPNTWNGQRPARTVPLYTAPHVAADRESVIAEILRKLDSLIRKGPLDEPANTERNGMVLAFNAVARLDTDEAARTRRTDFARALAAPYGVEPTAAAAGGNNADVLDVAINTLDLARDTIIANHVDVPRVLTKIANTRRMLVAAPTAPTPGGHCERAGGCVCGGDLPRVREGCAEWVKPAAVPAPTFHAKHLGLKQVGAKLILTLELDAVEGAPRYTLTPINPGVVRVGDAS